MAKSGSFIASDYRKVPREPLYVYGEWQVDIVNPNQEQESMAASLGNEAVEPALKRGMGLLEAVLGRYGLELHRYLVRRLRCPEDANDLAQEIYLRLLRRNKNEPVLNPRAYLYRIAGHVVSEFQARAQTGRDYVTFDSEALERISEQPTQSWTEDELSERLSAQRQMQHALQQLPPTHQAVFLLHKRDGHSHEEIADKLQLSIHTVEKYLIQAKARMKTMQWDR